AHYLFESYFCDPGKGHQKGQVENLVQFAQRQFFTPVPSVSSLVCFASRKCSALQPKLPKHLPAV
ncbi:IS21 family transposase, partial [Brevibacillus borstelensis]|nr:IS21 family transposase [Brevibacillus borstelensis]